MQARSGGRPFVRAWGTRRASAGPDSWLALATTVLAGSSDTCAGTQHQRGQAVCVNGLEAPMDITDHAVLGSIERDLLRPEVVERAIEFAIDELRPGTDATRRAELLAEIPRLDAELSRLTAAIARRGDLPALLAALKGTPGAARALRARRGSSWMPRRGSARAR